MSNKTYITAAFPHPTGEDHPRETGVALRDYMATHAEMQTLDFGSVENMAEFAGVPEHEVPSHDDAEGLIKLSAKAVAKARYIYADAMLEEKNLTEDQ